MTPRKEVERLGALADLLDPALSVYLRRLLAAGSAAHRYQEVLDRAERAEDLVAELRKRLEHAHARVDRAEAQPRGGAQ